MAQRILATAARTEVPPDGHLATPPGRAVPRWRRLLLRDPGRWLYPVALALLCVTYFAMPLTHGEISPPLDVITTNYPWNQQPEFAMLARTGSKNPLMSDAVDQFIPWYLFTRTELHHGRLPLWYPYSLGGEPHMARAQPAVLYPITILSLLMPLKVGMQFMLMVKPLIAGLGMYAFLLVLGLRRPSAFFGAIAFMFSSYFFIWLNHPHTAVADWLPWIFLCLEALLQKKSRAHLWVSALSIITATQFLGGHIESSLHILLFSTIYLGIRSVQRYLRFMTQSQIYSVVIPGILCFTGLVGGVAIAAVQLLPTVMLVLGGPTSTVRAHQPLYHIPFTDISSWIVPNLRGSPAYNSFNLWPNGFDYAEEVGYCGVVTLVLAGVALLRSPRRDREYTLTFLLLGLLAAAIVYGVQPVFTVARLPGLRLLANHRLVFVVAFFVSCLAAIGVDALLDAATTRWPSVPPEARRRAVWLGWGCFALATLFACTSALLTRMGIVRVARFFLETKGAVTLEAWAQSWVIFAGVMIVISAALLVLLKRAWIAPPAGATALALLLAGDVFTVGATYNPGVLPANLYPGADAIGAMRTHIADGKLALPAGPLHGGLILPFGLPQLGTNSENVFLSRPLRFSAALNRHGPDPSTIAYVVTNQTPDRRMLAIANASLLLVPTGDMELPGSGAHLVAQQEDAADQPVLAIAPGETVTQEMASVGAQISAVAVFVATDGLQPGPALALRLLDAGSGAVLGTASLPVAATTSGSWLSASFPAANVQPGQRLRLEVSRPADDTSGRAIRLFGTTRPLLQGARFLHNGQPAPGALRLRLYEPAAADTLTPVWHDNVTTLYRVEGFRPRVYVADGVIATQGDAATLAALDQLHVPGADAVVESRTPIASNGGQATIVRDLAGDITVKANMPAPGVLVLNEGYGDGGWQVTVDGKQRHDLRANYIYQGVELDAGQHTVHFSYRPPTWTVSLLISLVGVLITIGLFAWPLLRRLYKRRFAAGPA
ncbi:MAG TPA: YfhO family protein [Dehalococcoidia bacterium]|nr:YfhO family protein [Dehalococcoidia bacterium]